MHGTTELINSPVFVFEALVISKFLSSIKWINHFVGDNPASIETEANTSQVLHPESKCINENFLDSFCVGNGVVSIEFSPLSTVELTTNWYHLHNGDYQLK